MDIQRLLDQAEEFERDATESARSRDKQRHFQQAATAHEKAAKLANEILGPTDERTLEIRDLWAKNLRDAGDVPAAITCGLETVKRYTSVYRNYHEGKLNAQRDLAESYLMNKEFSEAIKICDALVTANYPERSVEELCEDRIDLTAALFEKALFEKRGDENVKRAAELNSVTLRMAEKELGKDHIIAVKVRYNLGRELLRLKKYEDALSQFCENVKILQRKSCKARSDEDYNVYLDDSQASLEKCDEKIASKKRREQKFLEQQEKEKAEKERLAEEKRKADEAKQRQIAEMHRLAKIKRELERQEKELTAKRQAEKEREDQQAREKKEQEKIAKQQAEAKLKWEQEEKERQIRVTAAEEKKRKEEAEVRRRAEERRKLKKEQLRLAQEQQEEQNRKQKQAMLAEQAKITEEARRREAQEKLTQEKAETERGRQAESKQVEKEKPKPISRKIEETKPSERRKSFGESSQRQTLTPVIDLRRTLSTRSATRPQSNTTQKKVHDSSGRHDAIDASAFQAAINFGIETKLQTLTTPLPPPSPPSIALSEASKQRRASDRVLSLQNKPKSADIPEGPKSSTQHLTSLPAPPTNGPVQSLYQRLQSITDYTPRAAKSMANIQDVVGDRTQSESDAKEQKELQRPLSTPVGPDKVTTQQSFKPPQPIPVIRTEPARGNSRDTFIPGGWQNDFDEPYEREVRRVRSNENLGELGLRRPDTQKNKNRRASSVEPPKTPGPPVKFASNSGFFSPDGPKADDWIKYLEKRIHPVLDKYRNDSWAANKALRTVKIAILDTGIAKKAPVPELVSRKSSHIKFGKMLHRSLPPNEDTDGHGTHAAGLILQVCPYADLYVYRVLKGNEALSKEYVKEAINDAIDKKKVDIISMSLGWDEADDDLTAVIERAKRHNTLIFAASSNEGIRTRGGMAFPARALEVIAVDAADVYGNPSRFNPPQNAEKTRFTTLGEAVNSSFPMHLYSPEEDEKPGWRRTSGTSCATPIAAGVAGLVLEFARQRPLCFDPSIEKKLKSFEGMKKVLIEILSSSYDGHSQFHHIDPILLFNMPPSCDDGGEWYVNLSPRLETANRIVRCLRTAFFDAIGSQMNLELEKRWSGMSILSQGSAVWEPTRE